MKKLGIVLVVLIVIALVAAFLLYPRIQQWKLENQQHELRIAIAEAAYLDQALQSSTHIDAQITAVVGSSIFDQALAAANGLRIALPSVGNATLQIVASKIDFRDGFPALTLSTRATRPDLTDSAVNATITAVLVPIIDQSNRNDIGFRLRLVDVRPEFTMAGASVKVRGFLQELARVKASEFEDALPVLTIPLKTSFAFQVPGQSIPTRIPNPDGWIDGNVQIPTMNVNWSIAVNRILFLSDGVHLSASLGQGSKVMPTPTYSWDVPSDQKEVEVRLDQNRKRISELRANLETLFGNEKIGSSDLSLRASPIFFTAIVDGLNSVSPPLDITLGDVSEHDYIKQAGGAFGYYVELAGRNSLQAKASIRHFRASWSSSSQLSLLADFTFSASAQLAYHLKTGIGGGVSGSVGTTADKGGTISGTVNLTTDGEKWPEYDVSLIGPPGIEVTLNAQIGRIGGVGFPVKFNLPVGTLAKGSAPALFSQSGSIAIPLPNGNKQTRQYTLSITPEIATFDQNGFATAAKVTIAWR